MAGVLREDGPAALDLARRGVAVLRLDVTERRSVQEFGETLARFLEDGQLGKAYGKTV
jgi:hypothetical protein